MANVSISKAANATELTQGSSWVGGVRPDGTDVGSFALASGYVIPSTAGSANTLTVGALDMTAAQGGIISIHQPLVFQGLATAVGSVPAGTGLRTAYTAADAGQFRLERSVTVNANQTWDTGNSVYLGVANAAGVMTLPAGVRLTKKGVKALGFYRANPGLANGAFIDIAEGGLRTPITGSLGSCTVTLNPDGTGTGVWLDNDAGGQNLTFTNPFVLKGACTFCNPAVAGNITLSGSVSVIPAPGIASVNISVNKTLTLTGGVTGTAGFTKSGAGSLVVAPTTPANNTITGTITSSGGAGIQVGTDPSPLANLNVLPGTGGVVPTLATQSSTDYWGFRGSTQTTTLANNFSGPGQVFFVTYSGTSNLTLTGDLTGMTGVLPAGSTAAPPGLGVYPAWSTQVLNISSLPASVVLTGSASNSPFSFSSTVNYTGTGSTSNFQKIVLYNGGAQTNITSSTFRFNSSGTNPVTLTGGIARVPYGTAAGTSTLTLGGSNLGDNVVSGAVLSEGAAGVLAITKVDNGRWVFSGNNSYTGATSISAGTLAARHSNALGAASGSVTVSSGATLEIANNAVVVKSVALSLGSTTAGNGILYSPSPASGTESSGITATSVTMSGANVFKADANATLAVTTTAGGIAGAHKITKQGAGTLKLSQSAASTFTQLEVQAGTLEIAGTLANSLPANATAADFVLGSANAGVTFRYSGSSNASLTRQYTIGNSLFTVEATGNGVLSVGVAPTFSSPGSIATLTFGGTAGTAAAPNTYSVALADNGQGAVTMEKTGTGAWKFTQEPSYTGTTRLKGGTLSFGGNTLRTSVVVTENSAILQDVILAGAGKTMTVSPGAGKIVQIRTSGAGSADRGNTTILSGQTQLIVEPADTATQPYKPLGGGTVTVGGNSSLKLPRGTNQNGRMSYGGLTLMQDCTLEIGG